MKKLAFLFVILTSMFITSCEKPIDEPIVSDVELTCGVTSTNVTTYGGNNGSITVTANGGTSPYTYSLNSGTFQTSNVFNSLTAGNYTIKVKDSKNKTADNSATISQPNPSALTATTTIVNVTTFGGSNGKITISARGGVKPYTYNIDGGAFKTDSIFSDLTPKSYTIIVKDSYTPNNTITLNNVVVSQPTQLSATATTTNSLCNGGNGTITINVTSGTPPYTYSLNSGTPQNSNVFNVVAGTYTITVKDTYNTITLSNNTITQPTQLTASSTKTNVLCNGGNGSIIVTANGGTSPYTYSLNSGTFQSSNTFTPTAGTYSVTIKDANGCTTTLSNITITQPSVLSASTSVVNVTTFGGNDGSITVTANGGTSPYTYTKNGTYQSSNVFSGLIAGTYTITIKDANGCTFTTSTINVTQPSLNVGDSYLGGIVCSIDGSGHGFVVYPTNNADLVYGSAITACTSLGSGWRLPTETELNTLLQSAKISDIYGLGLGSFWTSTQPNTLQVRVGRIFVDGTINFISKTIDGSTLYKSRAVKTF